LKEPPQNTSYSSTANVLQTFIIASLVISLKLRNSGKLIYNLPFYLQSWGGCQG